MPQTITGSISMPLAHPAIPAETAITSLATANRKICSLATAGQCAIISPTGTQPHRSRRSCARPQGCPCLTESRLGLGAITQAGHLLLRVTPGRRLWPSTGCMLSVMGKFRCLQDKRALLGVAGSCSRRTGPGKPRAIKRHPRLGQPRPPWMLFAFSCPPTN